MQRRYRLAGSADLLQLRRRGQRWSHPLAVLIVGKNNQEQSRFAFSASRRVGKAVARNRARRMLRESVRRHLATVKPGHDCLFLAREATPQATLAAVEQAVLELLGRAHLWQQT